VSFALRLASAPLRTSPYPPLTQQHRGAAERLAPTLAKLAASALIIASAGFGAYYAGSLGAEQGPLLAILSVAMAIGLELAKPFSVAAAFDAFRSSRICQGVAVALLGVVAISYSLSAELSLWAGTRSDKIAARAAESNVAISARDQYQRAKLELDGLPSARPAVLVGTPYTKLNARSCRGLGFSGSGKQEQSHLRAPRYHRTDGSFCGGVICPGLYLPGSSRVCCGRPSAILIMRCSPTWLLKAVCMVPHGLYPLGHGSRDKSLSIGRSWPKSAGSVFRFVALPTARMATSIQSRI
jgi:hypothetical protein